MSKTTIKVEFDAGCNIEEAFAESIRLAKLLTVWIEFNFNDVTCIANSNGIVDVGVKNYHKEIQKKNRFKFACSH